MRWLKPPRNNKVRSEYRCDSDQAHDLTQGLLQIGTYIYWSDFRPDDQQNNC